MIGKKKAPSYDGMTDDIFQTANYNKIDKNGRKPDVDADPIDKRYHREDILRILATKLRDYLNFCIKEKTRLMYNQDLLE